MPALSEPDIVAILGDVMRPWDGWGAASYASHGTSALVRQEARRIVRTVALLEDTTPASILEIGTGYLNLVLTLRRLYPAAVITGVEHPGRRYIWSSAYRETLAAASITLVATDVTREPLPFRHGSVECVVFAEVIEHLPPNTVPGVLAELARVLEAGGVLLLTTPNLAAWGNRELLLRGESPQQSPARAIDGTFGHLRLYTMAELTELLSAAGFVVRRRTFMDQVPVGASRARRALRALVEPVLTAWPALRDTCLVRADRVEGGR